MKIGDKTETYLCVIDTGAQNLQIATIFVDVRDWEGERGKIDYMHRISIDDSITNEEMTIFKAGDDTLKVKVLINGNICRLIVKKNNDVIFDNFQAFKYADVDHDLSPNDFS